MKYRRFAVLALGVLAFAVAGCGGDDSSSEASSDTQVEETATVDETTTEDTTAEDTTAEDTDTSTVDLGDLDNLDEDCLEFAGIGVKIGEAMSGTNGDISKTAELFDELVASAPDEIKDDLAVIAGGVATLAEAMQGVDITSGATPTAEQLAQVQEALASVDSAELEAASKNVEAWAQANCAK